MEKVRLWIGNYHRVKELASREGTCYAKFLPPDQSLHKRKLGDLWRNSGDAQREPPGGTACA
ncbi:hypothetical protein SBA4_6340009 [Candidatus Sulfopaludibacter sp. SbA4]|nr:hypothetical protein SBA4_6340009 [Candidatus Sulfopaludibacter sp. SbA4]